MSSYRISPPSSELSPLNFKAPSSTVQAPGKVSLLYPRQPSVVSPSKSSIHPSSSSCGVRVFASVAEVSRADVVVGPASLSGCGASSDEQAAIIPAETSPMSRNSMKVNVFINNRSLVLVYQLILRLKIGGDRFISAFCSDY